VRFSRETAFSGVFPTVDALRSHGAKVRVHDPLYTDEELLRLGFEPYHLGEAVNAAIVQADHVAYSALGPNDLPGLKAIIDGRRISSADRWPSATYRVIGMPTV